MNFKTKYFTKLCIAVALCINGTTYSMETSVDHKEKEGHFSCPTVEFLRTVEYDVTFEDKVAACFDIMKHIGGTGIGSVAKHIPINWQKTLESSNDDPALEVYIATVDFGNALYLAYNGLESKQGRKRIEKPTNEEDLKKLMEELAGELKEIVYHRESDKGKDLFPSINPVALFTNYVYPIKFVYEGQSYQAKVRPQSLKNATQFWYIEISHISRYVPENQYYDVNPIICYYKTNTDEVITVKTHSPAFSVLQYHDSIREDHEGCKFFDPLTVFVRNAHHNTQTR